MRENIVILAILLLPEVYHLENIIKKTLALSDEALKTIIYKPYYRLNGLGGRVFTVTFITSLKFGSQKSSFSL